MRRAAAGSVSSADPRGVQDAGLGADRPRVARLARQRRRVARRPTRSAAWRLALCLLAVPARSGTWSDRQDLPRAAPTTSATAPNADQAPRQQLERPRTPHHVGRASRGNLRELSCQAKRAPGPHGLRRSQGTKSSSRQAVRGDCRLSRKAARGQLQPTRSRSTQRDAARGNQNLPAGGRAVAGSSPVSD